MPEVSARSRNPLQVARWATALLDSFGTRGATLTPVPGFENKIKNVVDDAHFLLVHAKVECSTND